MAQTVLPFQYEVEKKEGGMTALAGCRSTWNLLISWASAIDSGPRTGQELGSSLVLAHICKPYHIGHAAFCRDFREEVGANELRTTLT